MDESLDDYISKSNFKIKIGNPKPSGFQGKKKATAGFQGNKLVTDVSITVPAVRKTGPNNKTNQMRDARERLVSKNKPLDAREKLNQKAQGTDARQKLMTIRSQKEPQDARAKIQAKKQQQVNQPQTQSGPFTLTRTVSNNTNNNIQLTPGPKGNINITKTLTKVMPPGYEHIIGPSTNATNKAVTPIGTSTVKNRLGPSSGTNTRIKLGGSSAADTSRRLGPPTGSNTNIANITRTISNTRNIEHGQHQQHTNFPQSTPAPLSYEIHPGSAQEPLSYVPPPSNPHEFNTVYQSAPPPQHMPPPTQTAPYPYPSHQSQPPYPSSSQPVPVQQAPPAQGPPYPVNDPIPAGHQYPMGHHSTVIPKIQVQNDQYRPLEPPYPQYAAPTQQHYAPPPQPYAPPVQQYASPQQQYMYPPAQQPVTYEPTPQETYPRPQSGLTHDANSTVFQRTIVNDVQPPQQTVSQTLPLKRRSTGELVGQSSSSGPLRLSSKNYVPIIHTTGSSESARSEKPKFSKITAPGEPTAKKSKEEDEENVISPLQGFKIAITNLAHSVTQDDIIELFGAIGAVKSVKMLKLGTAEVVYVKKDGAVQAAKSYHDRELDGLPMVVKLVTPVSARIKEAPEKLPASVKPAASSPLRFSKPGVSKGKVPDKKEVDVTTLHKALFKTGSSGPSKPVTFTVNI
ncbi:mitogen-activated protein kinase kinase kinase 7-interacting protein 3 homolog [Ruditapes philippinarum]|uniref:mitogen-activated protein kinase kinase kinase 7-interacting protein 3 homolog n=1 Tax=Ruditapes philippinarum TaxID=129788 RepID=UPI00295A579E|nr:mitogen-activated protein kinase kinase kinase 7-interacting protein 3 homolog [Ruditapes philippinarum]